MNLRLQIHQFAKGKSSSRSFEIKESYCIIGRRKADIQIADPFCSKRHAILYEGAQGRLILRDLASLNGTLFLGRRIFQINLRAGDEFHIGRTTFVIKEYSSKGSTSLSNTVPDYELQTHPTSKENRRKKGRILAMALFAARPRT